MRTIKRLLLFALPALLLAGCNNEDFNEEPGGQTGTNGDIVFEIGFMPQTRAATAADFTSTWEDGDEIGIFAVKHGDPLAASGNHIHNVRLTYTETTPGNPSTGSWSLDSGVELWFPFGGGKLDFYAYHPYDNNGGSPEALNPTAIAFNVKTDQSGDTGGKSNYNLSDLLTAKSDNSGAGWAKGSTVSLTFSHALAMVQVEVPVQGKGFGPGESLVVKLRSVKPGATLDLSAADGTTPGSGVTLATTSNDATNITMSRLEQPGDTDYETNYTYRALVPAQDVAQGARLFSFEHEQRILLTDGTLAQAVRMTAGRAETFERTLPATLVHTVFIPKGTFQMGSPASEPYRWPNETQHEVTLTKDFRMGKYPVTFAQYDAFCDATSRTKPSDSGWGRGDRPVINVNWNDAVAYCNWLTQTTGIKCSLPTEAQWEYACRGDYANKATETNTLPFGIGDGTKLTYDMANFWTRYPYDVSQGGQYTDNSSTGYKNSTTAVGFYPYANGYGLYDMHGNVFEWCLDQCNWPPDDYGSGAVTDPVGTTGSYRVLRGGLWINFARFCRSAYRYSDDPDNAFNYVGFRVTFVP